MSEHFFTKQDPGSDPAKITLELDRRAKYLQLIYSLDYQDAIRAVFLSDPVLEASYSALGDAPVIGVRRAGETPPGQGTIGSPTITPE